MNKNWIEGGNYSYVWSALLPKVMYYNSYNVYVETRDFNRSLKTAVVYIKMCWREQQQS
jgi:hypothetical protein